jgi:hypothetical protein
MSVLENGEWLRSARAGLWCLGGFALVVAPSDVPDVTALGQAEVVPRPWAVQASPRRC